MVLESVATNPNVGTMYHMLRDRPQLEKPKINMTPMIDVVFLLLIFFVLTFRIIIPEGDFNVRMSPMGQAQVVAIDTDSIQVRLIADENGSLSAIQLNGEDIENFDILRRFVSEISLTKPDLGVELLLDEHLRYDYVIRAITAVHDENIREREIRFVRQRGE